MATALTFDLLDRTRWSESDDDLKNAEVMDADEAEKPCEQIRHGHVNPKIGADKFGYIPAERHAFE